MPKASPIRSSFNAGELSPLLDGRVDVAKYNNGCRVMENFIPTVQGPAVRRAGTRFVAEVKASDNRTWLARFEFSTTQSYVLEFGDRYLRFYTNRGQLLTGSVAAYSGATAYVVGDLVSSGGVNYYCIAATTGNAPPNATYWYALTGSVYEIPTPWTTADLTDATDGTFTLSMAQSGDVIYIAHANYPLQKLSRFGATRWTLAEAPLTNGPFKTQNTTRTHTVYASATTGTITLTASSALFTSSMVGSFFYLEPADLSSILPWTAGQEYFVAPFGTKRRSDGKTYNCTTIGAPTAGKAWRTGADKPVHTYGTQADGDYSPRIGTNIEREGLDWQFVDTGFGYVKITGFTSATQVTAVVQGNNPLPAGVVGSGNATFRWALGSFSGAEGYPSRVTFFRERLTLAKGQQLYFSVVGDFENFAAKNDSGEIVADRAIQVTISSDQVNTVQWLAPSQALIVGTSGGEFACLENATSEPFAPGNVKIEQQTSDGSRTVTPIRVGYSVLMMQRSGRKLREINYNFQQQGWVTNDLTVLAEHVTQGGIQQLTWHKEPYVAAWAVRGDGQLLGFTFNKEQDVIGWHRHKIGGGSNAGAGFTVLPSSGAPTYNVTTTIKNSAGTDFIVPATIKDSAGNKYTAGEAAVESVCVIPAPDGTRDDLWLIVKRTINGQVKRYVEYLEREYQAGDTQDSCFYVDSGLSYNGPPTTTITGLSHLEGQTVQVLVNGATHPDRTVASGSITLQVAATTAHVGLACPATISPTRLEAGAGDGTAQGKTKRINKMVLRFLNTLGCKAGPSLSVLDEISFRDGSDPMDQPPPLFTGDKLMEWPGDYDFDGYIVVRQEQPLPMTLVAIMPQLHTFDR